MTQFVAASADSICRRSASRNEVPGREEAPEIIDSRDSATVAARASSPASENSRSKTRRLLGDRITPRSITFCNSRTLPGHEYSTKRRSVPSNTCVTLLPNFWANVWTKNATNSGMSSLRSRNGGTWLHERAQSAAERPELPCVGSRVLGGMRIGPWRWGISSPCQTRTL